MKKIYKAQKAFSFIPGISTVVIAFVTMGILKKYKASVKMWLSFFLTFFLSGSLVWLLNEIVMSGRHIVLNMMVSWLVLVASNILFVEIQIKCEQTRVFNKCSCNNKMWIIYTVATMAMAIGVAVFFTILLTPSVDIKDGNGTENTDLEVIKLEEILSPKDNYSAFGIAQSQSDTPTLVSHPFKEYDSDEITFQCKKISGIKTLQVTKITCDELTLKIDAQVESGNAEIVILVDGTYYAHVPINQISSIVLTNVSGRNVVVKMAAESAKVNISVRRYWDQEDSSIVP